MKPPHSPSGKLFYSSTQRARGRGLSFSQEEFGLLKVLLHLIDEFQKNFGRFPEETEPLIFVEGLTVPVHAPEEIAVAKLKKAASACGVDFAVIRDFLGHWEL
jgi:hypothetical protein